PILRDMKDFGNLVTLFSMAYDKGARVVGMIEDRLGETAFFDLMRIIYSRYQYRILRVADFRRELEAYTGYSWEEFFKCWLYGPGVTDWAVDDVSVQPPAFAVKKNGWFHRRRKMTADPSVGVEQGNQTRVVVIVSQRGPCSEQTTVGFSLPDCEGYPVRIPLLPEASSYSIDNPPATIQALPDRKYRVEVLLPAEPTQVAIDPDQVLIDRDPSNNFWKPRIRIRATPVYTFLEETDLTNAYDRWNIIFGPWIYGSTYNDPWYPRSTILGIRAGAYRTQEFSGGVYAGYRTDYRDFVVGADGLLSHWPDSPWQIGYNIERRLTDFYEGDDNALRAVLYGRYIINYGSSLYLPPIQYFDVFTAYQDDFLPFVK
ncbi:MAG: hypothetical protein ACRD36_11690, partial [Candidatus Acidiferrum sp.]